MGGQILRCSQGLRVVVVIQGSCLLLEPRGWGSVGVFCARAEFGAIALCDER